jgi:hypothetical protein
MTDIRIAKAKIKDGQFIVEITGRDKDTEKLTTLTCSKSKIHADLEAAFAGLADSVREILEWPSNLYKPYGSDTDDIRVTGVSWSWSQSTEVEGACIVFQVDLEGCTSPFCGTTPHLPFDQYSEGGEQPVMPDGAQDALNALKAEVQRFIDGKRVQGDLFEQLEAA